MKRLGLIAALCLCAVTAAAKQRNGGYILRLDADTRIARLDLETFLAVDDSIRGPVLWVQRGGRRYEIRDPSILDRAAEAIRPLTKINEEHEAFRRRTHPVYDEEEDLDREIDSLEEAEEEGEQTDETRLAELREKRRALAPRLRAAEAEEREASTRVRNAPKRCPSASSTASSTRRSGRGWPAGSTDGNLRS